MRKFFLKILVLAIPFVLLFSVPLIVMTTGREMLSFESITRIHNTDTNSLIGPAYSNPDKFLKLQSTLERRPEVLALGASRVMQVRAGFFNDPKSFYNAGGGVEKFGQFNYFLQQLPKDYNPKLLIICLDQFFFNKNFDDLSQVDFAGEYKDQFSFFTYASANCFPIWGKVLHQAVPLVAKGAGDAVGLNAKMNRNGFMHDGCYYYGTRISHPEKAWDYKFRDTYGRIENGTKRFQYAADVNPDAVAILDRFLAECKKRNIHVVAFIPPYAPSVFKKMSGMGDKYAYLPKIFPACAPVLRKYGFSLSDFTDGSSLGVGDQNFIDGFHGSDKVYVKLVAQLAASDAVMRQYCTPAYLDSLYAGAKSDLEVLK